MLSKNIQKRLAPFRSTIAAALDIMWRISVRRQRIRENRDSRLHIVTGADFTHANSLLNLLKSIRANHSFASVTVWDLGLPDNVLRIIETKYPEVSLQHFDFGQYPEFMNIRNRAGFYAWKPIIISQTASRIEFDGVIAWLDAGNIVTNNLRHLESLAHSLGFYSPYSSGLVKDWTHPSTIKCLEAVNQVEHFQNCNAAIIAIDLRQQSARALLEQWEACAHRQDCISPEGSNLENHRFDQSALSVISSKLGLNRRGLYRTIRAPLGILIHQDVD